MDLHDRAILLTGAGSGIGRELALQFAGHATRLTLVGRRADPLEELAGLIRQRGAQARVVAADLTGDGAPEAVVAAAREQFGDIDVLVNNAGNVCAGRLEIIDEADIRAQIALNLTAPILLTRAALPALRASGQGLIVNVSSGMGLVGMPFYSTYAATKAGVAHFGEALRRELHGEGVGVLNVYPIATTTPMMEKTRAGCEHGVVYESAEEVAAATIAGIAHDSTSVVRGGTARADLIARNRDDPASVDRMFADCKSRLEEAAAGHSSL